MQGRGLQRLLAAARLGFACRGSGRLWRSCAGFDAVCGRVAAGRAAGGLRMGGRGIGARRLPGPRGAGIELLAGGCGGLLWRPGVGSRPRGAGELPGALLRGVWGWWTTLGTKRGNWAMDAAGGGWGPRGSEFSGWGGDPGRVGRRGGLEAAGSRSLNEKWAGGVSAVCPRGG